MGEREGKKREGETFTGREGSQRQRDVERKNGGKRWKDGGGGKSPTIENDHLKAQQHTVK